MVMFSLNSPVEEAFDLESPLFGAAAVIEEAKRGLDRLHIDDNPGLASALAVGHAGLPIFISRLDTPGQGYYLVPWQDDRGIFLIVQIDARSMVMSSVAVQSMPLHHLTISHEDAWCVASEYKGVRVTGEPRLVWQPCRETSSPFLPLYEVPIENGSLFVGMDRTVHRHLTPFMKGG